MDPTAAPPLVVIGDKERIIRGFVRRLETLGCQVEVKADAA